MGFFFLHHKFKTNFTSLIGKVYYEKVQVIQRQKETKENPILLGFIRIRWNFYKHNTHCVCS